MMTFFDSQFRTLQALLNWRVTLDIFLIAVIIFFLYHTLRTTGTGKIVVGLMIAGGMFIAARILDLRGIEWIYANLSHVLLIALLIIFQPELRKILERAASFRPREVGTEGTKLAYLLSDVLFALAHQRRGALIVLPGKESIRSWTSNGIHLEARPSFPILMSIFDPHSGGHDGAIVVENGRISKFGVRLPLSKTGTLSEEFGTRHHAAMGLSEVTDASIIAVSEERGTITVFNHGIADRIEEKSALAARILAHFENTASYAIPGLVPQRKKALFSELGVSFLLAFVFWSTVVLTQNERREAVYTVPIEYISPAKDLAISGDNITEVKLHLQGSAANIDEIDPSQLAVSIDLSNMTPGIHRFVISNANIDLPSGVILLNAAPSVLEIPLQKLVEKEIRVKPDLFGFLPSDLRLASVDIRPKKLPVLYPADDKGNNLHLTTTPINLETITADTQFTADVIAPSGVKPLGEGWPEVEVSIRTVEK